MNSLKQEDNKQLAGCRVLIIDDEQVLLEVLQLFFNREGVIVSTAENLQIAHEHLSQRFPEHFDAVICDQRLPDGSGTDLLDAIQQASPNAVTILMSGFLENSAATYQYSRQLQKPVSLMTLKAVLVEELSKQKNTISETVI